MQTITLKHAIGECDIIIGSGLLNQLTLFNDVLSEVSHVVIISDENVAPLYASTVMSALEQANILHELIVFPAGEKHKTRETKAFIEDQLLRNNYGKDTLLMALGGGVVTDITGFIAATYCRGVPVIYMPTTLLAMVDAAIGGKTAVNTPYGKNLIGCFKQPVKVICDCEVLSSLSKDELSNGLAEAIKHAFIADSDLLIPLQQLLRIEATQNLKILEAIIARSCQIKCDIVMRDEYEQEGERQSLNFGHTIAHAIERLYDYRIAHGQAVHVGLWVESCMANLLGHLSDEDFNVIIASLSEIHFSSSIIIRQDDIHVLLDHMLLDKKAVNKKAKFVLLNKLGRVYTEGKNYSFYVENDIVKKALSRWIEHEKD